jgi:UDP-glucuronate 4-epimerase
MKVLVTGNSGFIGYHLYKRLCDAGHEVVGIDNLNNYYDVTLKLSRLKDCGFDLEQIAYGRKVKSKRNGIFQQLDIDDEAAIVRLFRENQFDLVCHLAAQAGVRYSLENPMAYIKSNVVGFLNILEGGRSSDIRHLIYASSSSVYGDNARVPFSTADGCNHPISLYAATKKSDELMADCYSRLFKFHAIGLRFFTVYGPWGCPDMALFKFLRAILKGTPIPVYNRGDLRRDFTYIDDIVEGIECCIRSCTEGASDGEFSHKVYNIGHGSPVALMDFISAIEECTGRKAVLDLLPMQPGDVHQTWADTSEIQKDFGFPLRRSCWMEWRNS